MMAPQPSPAMTYAPVRPASNWPAIIAAVLVLLLISGGVIWASLRAYSSHQSQISYKASSDEFNAAAALYEKGDYEAAAAAFRKVRATSKHGETAFKAGQGELFSYRQLGHRAQAQGDWARAVQWYEAAVAVAPTDPQAQQELAAARRATAAAASGPSARPTVTAMGEESELSGRKSPLAPGLTAQDFQNANNAAASEAANLAAQAEEAYRQGNNQRAITLWTKAVAKAPGSPAAIQAQQRLTEMNARTNLFQY